MTCVGRSTAIWAALTLAACSGSGAARENVSEPVASEASAARGPAAAVNAERRAFWQALVTAEGDPPDGIDQLGLELTGLLGDRDPAVRDGIAYTLLDRWIRRQRLISDDGVRRLLPALFASLERGAGTAGDGVYARSFSALILADIAARDAAAPFLTEAELAALVARAIAYAGAETDLRGYTGANGWAHAAAHTADWMAALAKNPRVDEAACAAIMNAVSGLVLRRHGYILHHGEDSRLARPVVEILTRGAVEEAAFDAWVRALVAPLQESADGRFDAAAYAVQRNARNLLVSVFVAVEFSGSSAPPGVLMARAVIRRVIGSP